MEGIPYRVNPEMKRGSDFRADMNKYQTRGNEMNFERSTHQLAVDEFMTRAGQHLPDKPTIPDAATRILRAKLIMEEAMETIKAMGVMLWCDGDSSVKLQYDDLGFTAMAEDKVNLVEVVDGCCDIAVVTTGTLSAFGVSNVNPQRLVDESNLAKFGEGGYCREDGKWIKPPNWKAPNLLCELIRQGWEGQ